MIEYALPDQHDNHTAFFRHGLQPATYRFAERINPLTHQAEYFPVSEPSVGRPIRKRVAYELNTIFQRAIDYRLQNVPGSVTKATLSLGWEYLKNERWLVAAFAAAEAMITAGPGSRPRTRRLFEEIQQRVLNHCEFAPVPDIHTKNIFNMNPVQVPLSLHVAEMGATFVG